MFVHVLFENFRYSGQDRNWPIVPRFTTRVLGKVLNKLLCFCSNPIVVFLYVLYM